MLTIGHPLKLRNSDDGFLVFTYQGRPETFPQTGFLVILAGILYVFVNTILAIFVSSIALLLVLGGIATYLETITLTIDQSSISYKVIRGLRFWKAHISGHLSDFEGLYLIYSNTDEWRILLVPNGCDSGYCLAIFPPDQKEAGLELCRKYSAQFQLPALSEPAVEDEDWKKHLKKQADIKSPLPESGIRISSLADGFELGFPKNGRFHSTLQITPNGIESGIYFGSNYAKGTAASWAEISEIDIEALRRTNRQSGIKVYWRIKKNWRDLRDCWWKMRCLQLKRPFRQTPWWATPWFFFERPPLTSVKTLTIRFWNKLDIQISSNEDIGDEGLWWLFLSLKKVWQTPEKYFTLEPFRAERLAELLRIGKQIRKTRSWRGEYENQSLTIVRTKSSLSVHLGTLSDIAVVLLVRKSKSGHNPELPHPELSTFSRKLGLEFSLGASIEEQADKILSDHKTIQALLSLSPLAENITIYDTGITLNYTANLPSISPLCQDLKSLSDLLKQLSDITVRMSCSTPAHLRSKLSQNSRQG